MMPELVELAIEVPPVVEEPRVTVVRCGESEVEVRQEYGGWVVVGSEYGARCEHEQALADAYREAEHEERRRLLYASLDRELAAWDSEDAADTEVAEVARVNEQFAAADDPSTDPVGTVRRDPGDGDIAVKIRENYWVTVRDTSDHDCLQWTDNEITYWEFVGAVPASGDPHGEEP